MLLDADLRRPSLHERLDLAPAPGLADALRGRPIDELLQFTRFGGNSVKVLTAGRMLTDPAAALAGLERTLPRLGRRRT